MTDLMHCSRAALTVTAHSGPDQFAVKNLVEAVAEVFGGHELRHAGDLLIALAGEPRRVALSSSRNCLVDGQLNVGAGEVSRALGQFVEKLCTIDTFFELNLPCVHCEDGFAPLAIGSGDFDFVVESAGARK